METVTDTVLIEAIHNSIRKVKLSQFIPDDERDMIVTDAFILYRRSIERGYIVDDLKATEGYLVTIVRNVIYKMLIKQQRHTKRNIDVDYMSFDNLLELSETQEDCLSFLELLTPEEKEILQLLNFGLNKTNILDYLKSTNRSSYLFEKIRKSLQDKAKIFFGLSDKVVEALLKKDKTEANKKEKRKQYAMQAMWVKKQKQKEKANEDTLQ